MAKRGPSSATFVVPVEGVDARPLVRAPRSILDSVPPRVETEFYEFAQPDDLETRRLHAKAIVLESDAWTAALIGSSNFTSAGLGLLANAGNLEINVALGAPARSPEAAALRSLVRLGDPLVLEDVDWEPEADDEESSDAELPLGFVQCLLNAAANAVLKLELDASDLPPAVVGAPAPRASDRRSRSAPTRRTSERLRSGLARRALSVLPHR